jgi:hypothetical protein
VRGIWALRAAVHACVACVAVACASTGDEQVLAPVVLGMTAETAPIQSDGNESIFQVQTPVPLPMRAPTAAEAAGLGEAPPYPRAPFLLASHVRVEVRYVLSNLDDEPRTFELLFDPWNEFVRYRPGIVVSDNEALPNLSGYNRFFTLAPKQRVEGVLTNDDTRELAVDLATAQAIAAAPPPQDADVGAAVLMNRAMNLQNRSSSPDPLLAPYIPRVIAGLTGFDVGLRAAQAGNIAIEITVDIKDVQGERVVEPGKSDPTFGEPGETLSPPGARAM